MIVTVRLLAFRDGELRSVEIPDTNIEEAGVSDKTSDRMELLELVWYHGQNDHQPQELPSVSMGDVAELWGKHYLCVSLGWKELSDSAFESYKALSRMGRMALLMRMDEELIGAKDITSSLNKEKHV